MILHAREAFQVCEREVTKERFVQGTKQKDVTVGEGTKTEPWKGGKNERREREGNVIRI